MIAKSTIVIEVLISADTNFQLIFSSTVSDNLPIVNTTSEALCGKSGPKEIRLLLQKTLSIVFSYVNTSSSLAGIPSKRN